MRDGKSRQIVYRNGGYGYFLGSTWLFYSLLDDDDEMEELMEDEGFYYGPRPGISLMGIMGMGITLFALMVVLRSFVAAAGVGKRKTGLFH